MGKNLPWAFALPGASGPGPAQFFSDQLQRLLNPLLTAYSKPTLTTSVSDNGAPLAQTASKFIQIVPNRDRYQSADTAPSFPLAQEEMRRFSCSQGCKCPQVARCRMKDHFSTEAV